MTKTTAAPKVVLKLASVKADLAREAAGDWVEYPEWPGVAFKVASLYAPAYETARDLLIQRLTKQFKGKPIPAGIKTAEFGKLYCERILQDWRGFDVKYSDDTALDTLTDPAFREVVTAVEWCAARVAMRDAEFIEVAAKN